MRVKKNQNEETDFDNIASIDGEEIGEEEAEFVELNVIKELNKKIGFFAKFKNWIPNDYVASELYAKVLTGFDSEKINIPPNLFIALEAECASTIELLSIIRSMIGDDLRKNQIYTQCYRSVERLFNSLSGYSIYMGYKKFKYEVDSLLINLIRLKGIFVKEGM